MAVNTVAFGHTLADLWRRPVFAITAVATIALCVGASGAVFSVVNALWLKPSAIEDRDRLVTLYFRLPGSTDGGLREHVESALRPTIDATHAFQAVTFELETRVGAAGWTPQVRVANSGTKVAAQAVASNYFDVLGVDVTGRAFRPDEEFAGPVPVAVVSAAFWQRHFRTEGFQPNRTLETTKGPVLVVGVAAVGFEGPRLGDAFDLWLPLGSLAPFSELAALPRVQGVRPLTAIARLRDGITLDEAQSQVRSAVNSSAVLQSLRSAAFRVRAEGDLQRLSATLKVQAAMAYAVLTFGALTLTSLFLSRVAGRRAEIAVRVALGATRGRIVGLIVAEIVVVTLVGCMVGIAANALVLATIRRLELPVGITVGMLDASIDWRVLLCSILVAVLAGTAATGAAIRDAFKTDVYRTLECAGSASTGRLKAIRRWVLGAQVAMSIALIAVLVSLAGRLIALEGVQPGFAEGEVIFGTVRPRITQPFGRDSNDSTPQRHVYYATVIERLRNLPGVSKVTYGFPPVLEGELPVPTTVATNAAEHRLPIVLLRTGPSYVNTIGAKLLLGRDLQPSDADSSADPLALFRRTTSPSLSAAVVNRRLAQLLWPEGSWVGQPFSHGGGRYQVVGVTDAIRHVVRSGLELPMVITTQALEQYQVATSFSVVVRAEAPERLVSAVTNLLTEMFPEPGLLEVRTGKQIVERQTSQERMLGRMLVWYAAMALVLVLVGVHGLTRLFMRYQRREIGTRMALGAPSPRIVWSIAGAILPAAAAGAFLGALGTAAVVRWSGSAFEGIDKLNPASYAVATVLVLGTISATVLATASAVRRLSATELLRRT